MNLADKLREAKNKLYLKANIRVTCEGDPSQHVFPDKCHITNEKTGEKWSVKFECEPTTDPYDHDDYFAILKDENGKLLDKGKISWTYPGLSNKPTLETIYGTREYRPIWDKVNSEFKRFQKEHHHIERVKSNTDEIRRSAEKRMRLTSYLRK